MLNEHVVVESYRPGSNAAIQQREGVSHHKRFLVPDSTGTMENAQADLVQLLYQQQRIAIARLFLKNPPIIFLDEPTASLDAITTEQIKESIDAVKRDRTVLIISHSISQIVDADHIYVMSEGAIVGEGTHESLYADGGLYRDIIDSNARTLNIGRLAATVLPAAV